jgi:hypothetical protein
MWRTEGMWFRIETILGLPEQVLVTFCILMTMNMRIMFFWDLTPPHSSLLKMEGAGTIYQTK